VNSIKKIIFTVIILQFHTTIFDATAQPDATVPTYHWANSCLRYLRLRGYLDSLNMIQQPFSVRPVVKALNDAKRYINQATVKASMKDQWLIDFLVDEFTIEPSGFPEAGKLLIQPGIWTDQLIISQNDETKFYTRLRSQLGVKLGKNLYFYNGTVLDQSLLDDPLYAGKKWRGFSAYTEQAYVRFAKKGWGPAKLDFAVTLGRDFLNWGSGKTGRLLFSDHAQPLDFLSLALKYKGLQLTTMAADLDQWRLSDSLVQRYGTMVANRFLSAHRLTFNFNNRFYLGLTEALLYGGPRSTWELKYHNPMLYYHGELINGGGYDGNGFLYLDFDWYPLRNWELYGEVLVDDFQVEKTGSGDLEPNEIGLIFGLQHANVLGIDASWLGIEYVRVANRTYNSRFEWEKLVHFNRPVGYALGNNFDRWNAKAYYFPRKGLETGVEFDYIRKGEGSVLDSWDTPWSNYTLSEGYHEPFPAGVVEKSAIIGLSLKYYFSTNAIIETRLRYQDVVNANHQSGKNETNWSVFFMLHWDISKNLDY